MVSMVTHEDAAKEKQAEIQGLVSLTDFGFFEAKGVCPNCRAVIDDIYKILCDTCQKKKGEKNE